MIIIIITYVLQDAAVSLNKRGDEQFVGFYAILTSSAIRGFAINSVDRDLLEKTTIRILVIARIIREHVVLPKRGVKFEKL
jgi:hypothetical protein